MIVELIFVGTELLLGNVVNTNAQFLSEKCASLGLSVYFQSVVGDNEERLSMVLKTAMERSDIVILSGGLGPTEDDLTKETTAKVFGLPLVEDAVAKEMLESYFAKAHRDITANNYKQVLVPEGSIVLYNNNGTAPGIIIEQGQKSAILLPGPPDELIPMFKEQVIPYLQQKRPEIIYSTMVKLCGVGESQAETIIKDLIEKQNNPTIAPYAKVGEVHLRVTAKAENEKKAKEMIKPILKELKNRFGEKIYSTDEEERLEEVVVKLLKEKELTLCTAESCTGGMVASHIVNVTGASDVFKAGFVTYANKAKRKYLGVNKNTLKKYTAVSEEVAKEMAKGGVFETDADICVSVTGLAGPDGMGDKPAGLVYVGCYYKDRFIVEEHHFQGNRTKIRTLATVRALDLVRRCILNDGRMKQGEKRDGRNKNSHS